MNAEPENKVGNGDDAAPISGDVIGDTAYSERFVLKILLKLANRDNLMKEMNEPTFEKELCTLWDMTAEQDVILYLQAHNTLNLFCFALPVIESSRIIELIIGTIANMCCHEDAANSLIANKDLTLLLLNFIKSDDSGILNQLLRLIGVCMQVADDRSTLMNLFETVDYAQNLYFILKNSSNTELLNTALENLNTIYTESNLDIEAERKFILLFKTPDAQTAVHTAHRECSGQASSEKKSGRLHLVALQMMYHLNSNEEEGTIHFMNLLQDILISYEIKMKDNHKIDSGLLDVAEFFLYYQQTRHTCSPEIYFNPCYNMWKMLKNGIQQMSEEQDLFDDIKQGLCIIMCIYLTECTKEHQLTVLENIGNDFRRILRRVKSRELQKFVKRVLSYRDGNQQ